MNNDKKDLSLVYSAERLAEKLVKKHKGNLEAIKKEIEEMSFQTKGFDYKKEVRWAAIWIIAKQK